MEPSTQLTPAERLAIYEKMLPYFEGEERLPSWLINNLVTCFCHCLDTINESSMHLIYFPELIKHKPNHTRGFWFETIDRGPDHTRTAILKQAINEVKQLIC